MKDIDIDVMILNPLSLNFVIWLPSNFFYNSVVKQWTPTFKRMFLPYVTIEDMFNSLIASVSFPSVSTTNIKQGQQNYDITKRGGKQLDQTMNKQLTLNVKLSEGYMTYFIARQQMEEFLRYGSRKDLYFPLINMTILDSGGFEQVTYTYFQLTPETLSDFDLSYQARPGSFNTFQWSFSYNYFDIYYRDENGSRKKMSIDKENGMLHDSGPIDLSRAHNPLSRMNNLLSIPASSRSMIH